MDIKLVLYPRKLIHSLKIDQNCHKPPHHQPMPIIPRSAPSSHSLIYSQVLVDSVSVWKNWADDALVHVRLMPMLEILINRTFTNLDMMSFMSMTSLGWTYLLTMMLLFAVDFFSTMARFPTNNSIANDDDIYADAVKTTRRSWIQTVWKMELSISHGLFDR